MLRGELRSVRLLSTTNACFGQDMKDVEPSNSQKGFQDLEKLNIYIRPYNVHVCDE